MMPKSAAKKCCQNVLPEIVSKKTLLGGAAEQCCLGMLPRSGAGECCQQVSPDDAVHMIDENRLLGSSVSKTFRTHFGQIWAKAPRLGSDCCAGRSGCAGWAGLGGLMAGCMVWLAWLRG